MSVVGQLFCVLPLFTVMSYGGRTSCSTRNAFRTARIMVSTRKANHVLYFSMTRNRRVRTGDMINTVSDLRLRLRQRRLGTRRATLLDDHPSGRGRMTSLHDRVTGRHARLRHIRGVLQSNTTAAGRHSSVRTRVAVLRNRLSTSLSAVSVGASAVGGGTTTLRTRVTTLSSHVTGYHVTPAMDKAMLIGCTRRKRFAATNGPLVGMTGLRRVCLQTCFASSRLTGIGLNSRMAIATSFNNSRQCSCINHIT